MLTKGEDLQAILVRLNNEQADWSKQLPLSLSQDEDLLGSLCVKIVQKCAITFYRLSLALHSLQKDETLVKC